MKIIMPGHKYELASFEGSDPQVVQFIEKEHPSMKTINDGTTNEEVLAMLIDRLRSLGETVPCRENSIAITRCEEALMWLNKRTADRKARGVEGTSAA
jgi:hypothetical protein